MFSTTHTHKLDTHIHTVSESYMEENIVYKHFSFFTPTPLCHTGFRSFDPCPHRHRSVLFSPHTFHFLLQNVRFLFKKYKSKGVMGV